jgi:hypothetical protein
MKYAVEMGLGAMMHIPSFIKTGSGIHKLMKGDSQTHGHKTHKENGDRMSLLYENRLNSK